VKSFKNMYFGLLYWITVLFLDGLAAELLTGLAAQLLIWRLNNVLAAKLNWWLNYWTGG
jgi:hypothetical protein